jgi:predicted amino acid dehydrogenase
MSFVIIHRIFSELNQRSTTGDPRLAFTKDASTKDSTGHYGHQSNALQILYGSDLSDKTAMVTGANTGIGFEIARSLAKHGCQVILVCRNLTKGEAACSKIRKEQVLKSNKISHLLLKIS